MRTKTILLSALLGAIGSVSAMAQTNVYSLNAVGYINVTVAPGFNQISCPLVTSPDNTVGTVLNNGTGIYNGCDVYFWSPANGYSEDVAKPIGGKTGTSNTNGWSLNGTNVLAPGVACWFLNATPNNMVITFVGTVPSGPITNSLVPGFNLVSSAVPMSGDLCSNSISALTNFNIGDDIYVYSASTGYTEFVSATGKFGGHGFGGEWTSAGDPIIPTVGQGFWYLDTAATPVNWVENYSVSQ